MAQAASVALLAAASISVGALLEVLALALGTGAGVGIGVRLALLQRARRSAPRHTPAGQEAKQPEWRPEASTEASTEASPVAIPIAKGVTSSEVLLFATAVGFALIGFFCGSLSGFVALVVLQGVRFLATGLAFGIANLITGLVAGVMAGYLVEVFGRRWQVVDDELHGIQAIGRRTVVIALAAGVVMGLLLGLLDTFGLGGTLLSVIGVGAVSVAVSLVALQARNGPPIQALFAKR